MSKSISYKIKFKPHTLKRLFLENVYRYKILRSASRANEIPDLRGIKSIFKSSSKLSYSATYIYSLLKNKPTPCKPSSLRYDAFSALQEEYYTYNMLCKSLLHLKDSGYYLYNATTSIYTLSISDISKLNKYLSKIKKSLGNLKRNPIFKYIVEHYIIKLEICWKLINNIPNLFIHLHYIFISRFKDISDLITSLLNKLFPINISILVEPTRSIIKSTHYITKDFDKDIFHPKNMYINPVYIAMVLAQLRGYHILTISRNLHITKSRRHNLNEFINYCDLDISKVYLSNSSN